MAHHDIVDYISSVCVSVKRDGAASFHTMCPNLETAANYANTFLPADPDLRWIKFRVILNSQQCDRAVFAYVFEPDEVLDSFKIEDMIECARQNLIRRGVYNL